MYSADPGYCNGNPETTVLAHIRIAGLCGTGIKPPDLIAAIACSSCHDEIDRRTRLVDAEYAKSARWREWPERRLSG